MSGSKFKIIAGLGNPGDKYAQTRHNIGFSVVDAVARQSDLSIDKSRFDAQYGRVRLYGKEVFLLKPISYMNRSGFPIHKFASYYKVGLEDIIVVHDDMDLSFGQIKIVKGRGHGGHNGVRSILDVFGEKTCVRVRVGVSHPGTGRNVTGHVLGRFSPEEKSLLGDTVDKAADACLYVLKEGAGPAMNTFNSRK